MYSSVVTLANSIIGVSILAMPYCFKQCGVLLATLMIVLSGVLVKLSCHLLLKSAIMARRRNIEYLAFHTYGTTGKLLVELGIIGFLIGTAIAFFVVMGDLGPPLVANIAGVEATANLRLVIITGLGLFVALPLSLLRNIDSLQIVCTTSIIFYLTVVFRVVLEASSELASWDWLGVVNVWRPAGILQCFPIFSMALACQPNIFEVYASLPEASPQKMNKVINGAVNLCSALYITIGFFGYIAFCETDFGGNILTSFTSKSRFTEFLKLGFVMSVAVSFPLVIFPCRTSIHSLLFRKTYQGIGSTELVADYIPPTRFTLITAAVICITAMIGIMIPDIEIVLGLVGSTMGTSICVIFPAVAFLKLTTKNTTERLAAQGALIFGIVTLILGTYVNVVEHLSSPAQPPLPVGQPPLPAGQLQRFVEPLPDTDKHEKEKEVVIIHNISESVSSKATANRNAVKDPGGKSVEALPPMGKEDVKNVRKEPAVPDEPVEVLKEPDKVKLDEKEDLKDNDKKEQERDQLNEHNQDKEKDNPAKEYNPAELILELAKQKRLQEEILQEQKQILQQLKEHKIQDAEELHALHQQFQHQASQQQLAAQEKNIDQLKERLKPETLSQDKIHNADQGHNLNDHDEIKYHPINQDHGLDQDHSLVKNINPFQDQYHRLEQDHNSNQEQNPNGEEMLTVEHPREQKQGIIKNPVHENKNPEEIQQKENILVPEDPKLNGVPSISLETIDIPLSPVHIANQGVDRVVVDPNLVKPQVLGHKPAPGNQDPSENQHEESGHILKELRIAPIPPEEHVLHVEENDDGRLVKLHNREKNDMIPVDHVENANHKSPGSISPQESQLPDEILLLTKSPKHPLVDPLSGQVRKFADSQGLGQNAIDPQLMVDPENLAARPVKTGRDLKFEHRIRREICDNDPNCEDKFDRNPLKDSYLDSNYADLLNVGRRTLLGKTEIGGNYSVEVDKAFSML